MVTGRTGHRGKGTEVLYRRHRVSQNPLELVSVPLGHWEPLWQPWLRYGKSGGRGTPANPAPLSLDLNCASLS